MRVLANYLFFLVIFVLAADAAAQQPIIWSSKKCVVDDCQSSIARPGTFSDGSGIFTEAMQSGKKAVVSGIMASDAFFEVLLAFGLDEGGTPYKVNPTQAVTIEAGSMILYPADPQTGNFKKSITSRAFKPQFKKEIIFVRPTAKIVSGFLFFPSDKSISKVTVVVEIDGQILRFPFVRDPNYSAKFADPDNVPATVAKAEGPPMTFSPETSVPIRRHLSGSSCSTAIQTHIDGDFNGWEGETVYKMDDGSIWQQASYHYHYHYAYHPAVLIYESGGICHIKVDGDSDDGVAARRLN